MKIMLEHPHLEYQIEPCFANVATEGFHGGKINVLSDFINPYTIST